jgi:hypothetical protein
MGGEYERLFGALPRLQTPVYLCERVLAAVSRERVRILRTRLVFSSCTGILSLCGIAFASSSLAGALRASGFDAYASLLVSDTDVVAHSAPSFLLSLLESLPGPEVILTLALLAVFIQSARVLVASGIDWTTRPALA